jgi:hypothetical protein
MAGAPLVLAVASGQSVETHGSGAESRGVVLSAVRPALDVGTAMNSWRAEWTDARN